MMQQKQMDYGGYDDAYVSRGTFPFRALRYLGYSLVMIGVVAFCIGVADVVYTAVIYGPACSAETIDVAAWKPYNPCDNGVLKWTWVAPGVWCGIMAAICGAIGAMFTRNSGNNIRRQRDTYAAVAGLLAGIFAPCLIILSCLEAYYQDPVFYNTDGSMLVTRDVIKLVLPIMNAICGFFMWCLALGVLSICCCCASIVEIVQEAPEIVYVQEQQKPVYVQAPPPQPRPVMVYAPPPPAPPPPPPAPPPPPPPIMLMPPPPPPLPPPPPPPPEPIYIPYPVEMPPPMPPPPPPPEIRYVEVPGPPQPPKIVEVVKRARTPPPIVKVVEVERPPAPPPPPPRVVRVMEMEEPRYRQFRERQPQLREIRGYGEETVYRGDGTIRGYEQEPVYRGGYTGYIQEPDYYSGRQTRRRARDDEYPYQQRRVSSRRARRRKNSF